MTLNRNPAYTVERVGADEKSFVDVFELLLQQHEEIALAPFDQQKAVSQVWQALCDGMTFVARKDDGKAVGTISLAEVEWWFGKHTYLTDRWFYVLPRYRRGPVGHLLLRAATAEADERKIPAFVDVVNPNRRHKKTSATLQAIRAGYLPVGYTLKLR